YAESPTEAWLANEALKRGIVLHTLACGGMGGDGQRFFEEMARRTEGRPFRLADAPRRRHASVTTTTAGATTTTASAPRCRDRRAPIRARSASPTSRPRNRSR